MWSRTIGSKLSFSKKKEKKEKKKDQSWKWMGQLSNQMENFGNIKIILFKYENRF